MSVIPSHFFVKCSLGSIVALAILVLSGCATLPSNPVYGTLDVEVPSSWTAVPPSSVSHGSTSDAWWQDFNDPVLDTLVTTAFDANRDLRIAAARLAQSRALLSGFKAERLPRVDTRASVDYGRDSAEDPRTERADIGLRAAWEIDLFGKGALAVRAARAESDSMYRALEAARIALAADVSSVYFELRTIEKRLSLKREAIELAQRQEDVSQRKFEAGQVTVLDIERWQARLAQERVALADLEAAHRLRLQQLALLLGSTQVPDLGEHSMLYTPPKSPASLLPAEILERRPDVRQPALSLDAALARAGVARKEVYPSLQITWSGTQENLAVQGSPNASRLLIAYGVSLSLPVFDSGRIHAHIKLQDARVQEALAVYEKAMLTALVDVESSFSKWADAGASFKEWQQAETISNKTAHNAARLYDAGLCDLSAVLDARNSHLQTRDALALAMGARWEAAVGLRRAFAGRI